MKIFTLGFTKKTAESFFGRLERARVRRLVDVRLNNVSQLAGFTKRDDLAYFVCGQMPVMLARCHATLELPRSGRSPTIVG